LEIGSRIRVLTKGSFECFCHAFIRHYAEDNFRIDFARQKETLSTRFGGKLIDKQWADNLRRQGEKPQSRL